MPHKRDENVLVEYSINGGIDWTLLFELYHDKYELPE